MEKLEKLFCKASSLWDYIFKENKGLVLFTSVLFWTILVFSSHF